MDITSIFILGRVLWPRYFDVKTWQQEEAERKGFFDIPIAIVDPEDVAKIEPVFAFNQQFASKSECRIFAHKLGIAPPRVCL
jgi:hypothetical protein